MDSWKLRQRRETAVVGCASRGFRPWARCDGRMNNDSSSENSRQLITMIGTTRVMRPMGPGRKASGANAATVVSTPNVTGTTMVWAPRIAPNSFLPIFDCWVWVFSPTTMASSTTIPSTTMKPSRETKLTDIPRWGITATAPRKEMGMPRLTHMARRSRRNSARMRTTRRKPPRALRIMVFSRSERTSELSLQTVRVTPSGMRACACSAYLRTSLEIWIDLCPPTRYTLTSRAGWPSKRARWSDSSKASTTRATSPRTSRVPSLRVTNAMFPKSSAQ
jgi:hypothetical protein